MFEPLISKKVIFTKISFAKSLKPQIDDDLPIHWRTSSTQAPIIQDSKQLLKRLMLMHWISNKTESNQLGNMEVWTTSTPISPPCLVANDIQAQQPFNR